MAFDLIMKGKIWKTGNSYVFTIPSDYIKNKMLKVNKEYVFKVKVGD